MGDDKIRSVLARKAGAPFKNGPAMRFEANRAQHLAKANRRILRRLFKMRPRPDRAMRVVQHFRGD